MHRVRAPERGALFVLSGPSGVGKSTLIRHVLEAVPHLGFSVSATTRPPRPGEVDGVHYHFLDENTFLQRVAEGAFLEHAGVYGRRYGTLAAPTEQALSEGRSLLLDIDVQGAEQVDDVMPEAVRIFILPPDRHTVERRLRARGTDDESVIQRRLADMDEQLQGCGDYDYLVVNDDLDAAKAQLAGVLLAEMGRTHRHPGLVSLWTGSDESPSAP